MNIRYYAIKDVLVGSYQDLKPIQNDEVAKRALALEANNPESFKGIRNDIQLWYIQTLNCETGEVIDNNPYLIGDLMSFAKSGGTDGEESV